MTYKEAMRSIRVSSRCLHTTVSIHCTCVWPIQEKMGQLPRRETNRLFYKYNLRAQQMRDAQSPSPSLCHGSEEVL